MSISINIQLSGIYKSLNNFSIKVFNLQALYCIFCVWNFLPHLTLATKTGLKLTFEVEGKQLCAMDRKSQCSWIFHLFFTLALFPSLYSLATTFADQTSSKFMKHFMNRMSLPLFWRVLDQITHHIFGSSFHIRVHH